MKTIAITVCMSILLVACIRNEKVNPQSQTVAMDLVDDTLKMGSFVTKDAGHPTSGNLYLIKKKDGTRILQFVNLTTGAGPDVDILISKVDNTYQANSVIKLDDLKYSGTFVLDLPNQIDVTEYPIVMIWCKEYNIVFGTSKLQ